MYIVENVKKRFVRVLRSVPSTNKSDRHDITEKIVKSDVKHHNPLTLTKWLTYLQFIVPTQLHLS